MLVIVVGTAVGIDVVCEDVVRDWNDVVVRGMSLQLLCVGALVVVIVSGVLLLG